MSPRHRENADFPVARGLSSVLGFYAEIFGDFLCVNGERHMAPSTEERQLAYLRAHQRETAERIESERIAFMGELGLVQYTPWGVNA